MSSKKKKEPIGLNFSETIAQFNSMLDTVRKDFIWHSERVKELEGLQQDYLHQLELENLTYNERARIATQLANVRKERRVSKDIVENLRPLYSFMQEKRGVDMQRTLNEILGKTRIVEECFSKRIYIPRVLGNETFTKTKEFK